MIILKIWLLYEKKNYFSKVFTARSAKIFRGYLARTILGFSGVFTARSAGFLGPGMRKIWTLFLNVSWPPYEQTIFERGPKKLGGGEVTILRKLGGCTCLATLVMFIFVHTQLGKSIKYKLKVMLVCKALNLYRS